MPIVFAELVEEGAQGDVIEVECNSEEFHDQIESAVRWLKLNSKRVAGLGYVCDIGFQHEQSDTVIFGYALTVEQMKVFVDANVELWLSRLRDEEASSHSPEDDAPSH